MIAPAPLPSNKAPSFWMTALSLMAAGWVASFFVGLTQPLGLGFSLAYAALVSALVGGFALRFFLPLLAGVEIGYLWAVAAVGLGSLVSTAVTTTVRAATLHHAPSIAPVIWSSPALLVLATATSFAVSYWVISIGGHTRAPRPTRMRREAVEPVAEDAPDDLAADLVRTQNAVTNACIDISRASAAEIPGCVVDALTEISLCAARLRATNIPDDATRSVVSNLAGGLDHFSEALGDIASDAAAIGTDRLPQRGLLFGSLADVSDGGGRARYELDHADGLAEIRAAFEALRALGYLREDA